MDEAFVQTIIIGLSNGLIYALVALGYTLVYGIIELINFAHGDVYMMGFFISLSFLGLIGATSTLSGLMLIWVIPAVMFATMVCTGLINLTLDRIAYKPLRRAPRLAPLITAVGASFVLTTIAQSWKGPSQVLYPNIFPTVDVLRDVVGLETQVLFTTKDVFLIGVTVPLMVALHLFIRRSTLGKAMRATAQDREAAAMDVANHLRHGVDGLRRQRGRRLIEHEDAGARHQGARNGEQLLLAARERPGRLAPPGREEGKGLVHPGEICLERSRVGAADEAPDAEILIDRQQRKDVLALRHEGQASPYDEVRGEPVDALAVELDTATAGRHQARDRLERRRFPGAVAAEERHDRAGLDAEREPVEDLRLAVPGLERANGQHAPRPCRGTPR